jgi:hypothetical protein
MNPVCLNEGVFTGEMEMAAPPQGFRNPACYARGLGGCSTLVDREHYVSESILKLIENQGGQVSKSVRVFGLNFQPPGDVQHLGVASLAARILCRTHNGLLSPFDDAGKAMFLAMDGLNKAAGNPTAPHQVFRVDGDGLERWMLKVFFGGLYSGAFQVGQGIGMKDECPPVDLLDILFNGAAFPARQGLYWMPPKQGEWVIADQQILQIGFLLASEGQDVGGFRIRLFGFDFTLLIADIISGVPTMFDSARYRPAGLQVEGSNARIEFDWSGGAQSAEIIMQHHQT